MERAIAIAIEKWQWCSDFWHSCVISASRRLTSSTPPPLLQAVCDVAFLLGSHRCRPTMHSRLLGYNLAIVPLDSFRHAGTSGEGEGEERGGCHDIPMRYRECLPWLGTEHNADIQTRRGTTSNRPLLVWLFADPRPFPLRPRLYSVSWGICGSNATGFLRLQSAVRTWRVWNLERNTREFAFWRQMKTQRASDWHFPN